MLRGANESIRQQEAPTAQGNRRLFSRTPDVTASSFLADPSVLLPDWCNAGIAVRIITGANFIAMALAAVISHDVAMWVANCLRFALTLEPVLLTSLLLACAVRPLAKRMPYPAQVVLMLLIPAILTVALEKTLAMLLYSNTADLVRDAAIAALAAGITLYWGRLRSQSHLPALAEARVAALQARIRPHFLFNSLNAVLGLIRTDARRAEHMLEDLADLFRVLMRDHHERVSLKEEMALCRQYLAIESLRLGERLKIDIEIDPRAESAQVPLLLLQPLIENSVLHGIEPVLEPGSLEVRIVRRGHIVEIRISNPWHGTHPGRGHQIGLSNVRQRLELLHDLEARLDTKVVEGRFEVMMILPYIKQPGFEDV